MLEYYNTLQASIKKHILDKYGEYLSETQKNSLNNKNYLTEDIQKITDIHKLFNHVITKILNDLLYHQCNIRIENTNNEILQIPCGKRLQSILVNYYTKDLADYLKFIPKIDLSLSNEIDYIKQCNELFDNIFDKNAFIKNVNQLEKIDEICEFINDTIDYDINTYLDNNYKIESNIEFTLQNIE